LRFLDLAVDFAASIRVFSSHTGSHFVYSLRSISTCVSAYGFDLLFRLAHTACICHRLCGRESVGFAADRSFSTAFEHCIHAVSPRCSIYDAFRSQIGPVSMVAFPPHLQLTFPVTSELALSAHTYGLQFRRSVTLAFFRQPCGFEVYQIRLRAMRFGPHLRFNQIRHFCFHRRG
jgi:hypothetical protein